jgi:hypothetical protein
MAITMDERLRGPLLVASVTVNLKSMQKIIFYNLLALKSGPTQVCKYNSEQDRKLVLSSTDFWESKKKKVALSNQFHSNKSRRI